MYLAKCRKIVLFLKYICTYQKKAIPLHSEIKNLIKKFYILTISFSSQIIFIYKHYKLYNYEKFRSI